MKANKFAAMKINDLTYRVAWAFFYILAFVVTWNWVASESWRFLTETNRKLLAMVGLCLYILLVLERKHRIEKSGW